jgi:AcrR family transcriptional regulator
VSAVEDSHTSREEQPRVQVILAGAAEVFSQRGFAATSMRQLARHTGASLGSIYYHFENKEAILGAIICGNFRRVSESLDVRLAGVEDPRVALEVFVGNHLLHFSRHLPEMRVMSHELDTLQGEAGEEVMQLRRAYTRRARELVARLRPELTAEQLRVATLSLFGMLNWSYRWYHTLSPGTSPARLGQYMASLFLDGLLAHPAASDLSG